MSKRKPSCHYVTKYKIPSYLVQEISDDGMFHAEHGGKIETDDLRVCVEISSGIKILLDGICRLVMTEENVEVQYLVEVEKEVK